jgi:hypothetical protein
MTLSIKFPDLRGVPAEVTQYATQSPDWQSAEVADLAHRMEIGANVEDRGLWLVVSDGRAALEVYQASHSFRFSRLDVDEEGKGREGLQIERERAIGLGEGWTQAFAPTESRWEIGSVTEQEVLIAEGEGREPRQLVVGLQVNYGFRLDDLPLLGPGGKMQVAVGATGEITGAYRFWREPRAMGSAPTVPPEVAFERFAGSELFVDLSDETASAEVGEVRLGYLTLPPTEIQAALTPAYELRGVLTTEAQPRYEFISYVAAIDIDQSGLKRSRLSNASPTALVA